MGAVSGRAYERWFRCSPEGAPRRLGRTGARSQPPLDERAASLIVLRASDPFWVAQALTATGATLSPHPGEYAGHHQVTTSSAGGDSVPAALALEVSGQLGCMMKGTPRWQYNPVPFRQFPQRTPPRIGRMRASERRRASCSEWASRKCRPTAPSPVASKPQAGQKVA